MGMGMASRSTVWRLLTLAGLSLVATKLGLVLAFPQTGVPAAWPPTGIAMGAMLVFGLRGWPAVLLGVFAALATTAGSAWPSLGIAVGNTAAGLLGAFLVTRHANGRAVFGRARDVFTFAVLAGLLATAAGATIATAGQALGGLADRDRLPNLWLSWWLADVVGALVAAPAFVLWATNRRVRITWARGLELALLLGAMAVVVGIGVAYYPLEFLCIPPLIVIALRFSPREAASCVVLVSGLAIWATLEGFGPFVRSSPDESRLLVQAFMATLAMTTIPLAAFVYEHARREASLARAAAIVASTDDAIIGKTLDGLITSWNDGARRLYGYAAHEVIGRPISIIIPPELGEELSGILDRLRRGERVHNYETVRVTKDGRCIDVSVTVSPTRDRRGRIVGASSIARDITHRKLVEAATREREALRSVTGLAAAAAHEINNPLAVVVGQAQLMADEIVPRERERVEEILDAATRIQGVVDRMQHINRIEMADAPGYLPEMLDIQKSSDPEPGGRRDA